MNAIVNSVSGGRPVPTSLFHLEDVRKTFAGVRNDPLTTETLAGVSLCIEDGSFVSILGPSGCGKTTLLRILAGLTAPTSGLVCFKGVPVSGTSPERTIIFQDYGLFAWKDVLGNVEFGLKAKGFDAAQRRRVALQFIRLVHLAGAEAKFPAQLSGGMKQRAAIARALAVDPQCILMDEPFAALDSETRLMLQDEILRIWEATRRTIIMVTHNVEEAVFLSDRVIVLSAAPSRVVLDLAVTLPRPRPSNLRRNELFLAVADQLWSALKAEARSQSSGETI